MTQTTRRNRSATIEGTEVEDVDKDFLYGEFADGEELKRQLQWSRLKPTGWREKLAEKAAHKSLDIARDLDEVDDMEIRSNTSTTNHNGVSLRDLLLIGLAGGGLWLFANRPTVEPAKPPVDTDTVNINRLEFAEPVE